MKILSKITVVVLALGVTFALTSCDDNTCYECPGFTDGTTEFPDEEVCEDDAGIGSSTLLDLQVATLEASGYVCSKK